MEAMTEKYWQVVQKAEAQLLPFLRTFEAAQEDLIIGREREVQERVRVAAENLFPTLTEEIAKLAAPEPAQDFHPKFAQAISRCGEAYTHFSRPWVAVLVNGSSAVGRVGAKDCTCSMSCVGNWQCCESIG